MSTLKLEADEIHIWCVSVELPARLELKAEVSLSADERVRAARFFFDRDRRRFIARRSALRALLSAYTGQSAAALCFRYGAKGKPELAQGNLHFNLSHSKSMALIAFSQSSPLGVDLECVRPVSEMESIVDRFFSAVEREAFQRLPVPLKKEAFFNGWTRKEAFVKALGDGLHIPLGQFDVTLDPTEAARLVAIEGSAAQASAWSLFHLTPKENYVGALAVSRRDWRLLAWTLDSAQRLRLLGL